MITEPSPDLTDNLNHPKRIQFTNGNTIEYAYAPDGQKLRATYQTAAGNVVVPLNTTQTITASTTSQTDYMGNVILSGTSSGSSTSVSLNKFLFAGGYLSFPSSTTSAFHYYTQDHLGNNRAVVNESGTIEQITHYYPFGGFFADAGTGSSLQPYKYNGKELDRMHGLDLYDYGARHYDAIVPMFTQVDPLCEKYYSISPYAYCMNNPVIAIDYDGRDIVYILPGGVEEKRIESKINVTYVHDLSVNRHETKNLGENGATGWIQADMPGVINGYSDSKYQKYDYLIAAEVSYFNQNKNAGNTPSHTNGKKVDSTKDIPDLDPSLVKSIIMEETKMGTVAARGKNDAKQDIMQANVWYSNSSNDWNDSKKQFGLQKEGGASPSLSVHAGIGILFQKGLRTTKSGTTFRGWNDAVKRYNGGGNPYYFEEVMNYFNNITK